MTLYGPFQPYPFCDGLYCGNFLNPGNDFILVMPAVKDTVIFCPYGDPFHFTVFQGWKL